jgi:hypothetical protein
LLPPCVHAGPNEGGTALKGEIDVRAGTRKERTWQVEIKTIEYHGNYAVNQWEQGKKQKTKRSEWYY